MKYFLHISSLGDLKMKYRQLAKRNHPDLGGDTRIMQEINDEFTELYEIWKDRKEVANNGYDEDYKGATAKEYSDFVYHEYCWKGENFDSSLRGNDLGKIFRQWLKKTYPTCKFSVKQGNGSWTTSFYINLYEADFNPFKGNPLESHEVNHYHLQRDEKLNARGMEVMANVIKFVQSYNYDNSNAMIDYFDTNFYVTFAIGSYDRHFKVMPVTLKTHQPIKRKKLSEGERIIRDAMKGCKWAVNEYYSKQKILCLNDDSNSPYALFSYNEHLIPNKVKKLNSVGILSHIGRNGLIFFEGYSEELKAKLAV